MSFNSLRSHQSIRPGLSRAIIVAPILTIAAFALFLAVPSTNRAADWLLDENHPVELATFLFLLWGAILGLALARRMHKRGGRLIVGGFYAVFSVGLLITAMEEVAWGQFLFGFEPPAFIDDLNVKGETTIHNIRGLDGRTEALRVLFGFGGLCGLWLSRFPSFEKIAPPWVLCSWFLVILALASLDLWNDFAPIHPRFDHLVARLNEVVEMLIGMAGWLFVVLNTRRWDVDRR